MAKIIIYGWYDHNNIVDELMALALKKILDGHELKFVSHITATDYQQCDKIIIGGGSFLSLPMNADKAVLSLLEKYSNSKPIFYVGVGAETEVHSDHVKLLSCSKGNFIRSNPSDYFSNLNCKYTKIPDLSYVFATTPESGLIRRNKSLLVLPNTEVVSNRESAQWKRAAWEYFKSECSQALDELIYDGWKVTMAPFCNDPNHKDEWAAAELALQCTYRSNIQLIQSSWMKDFSFQEVRKLFDQHTVVLTQRFHGAPIAQITSTPCVVIHHHDKLANISNDVANLVPYYGIRKDLITAAVKSAKIPLKCKDLESLEYIRKAVDYLP